LLLIVSWNICFSNQISKKEVVESEFNPTFVERILPKLDWSAVYGAAQVVSVKGSG